MIRILKKIYTYNKNDCIYGDVKSSSISQKKEFNNRKNIAKKYSKDFYSHISEHHSIQVMDTEIINFLKKVPKNSLICDIGGCWGWHWRNIGIQRPDIKILIVDFIYENLLIAKKILKKNINKQIYLVNDDCCSLKFKKKTFDAVWTVQTLQHVPRFSSAIKMIYKILKKKGLFYNYNLNINYIIQFVYKIFNKEYIIKGYNDNFYLARSSKIQKNIIEKIFKRKPFTRYTELLFHPDLKIKTGSKNSLIGKLDSVLSGSLFLKKLLARQECFWLQK